MDSCHASRAASGASRSPIIQWLTVVLKALLDAYPHDISKEALAEEAHQSASSSGYSNNLGSLRSLGLIEYPSPGRVTTKPLMFLDGR